MYCYAVCVYVSEFNYVSDCDFDLNVCGYTNISNNDKIVWSRISHADLEAISGKLT